VTSGPARTAPRRRLAGLFWLAAAVALSLSVLALNKVPLYYFDSAGYKLQGESILGAVLPDGFLPEKTAGTGSGGAAAGGGSAGDGGDGKAEDGKDGEVNVSRSPTYAVLVALGWISGPPYLLVLLNLVAVLATSALVARAVARATFGTGADLTLIAAPLVIASFTALPFYIAYIMPDTFAAIAILVMALVVAYSRHMTAWELLFAVAMLAFSVMVHRSHLLLVGLAVPVAGLIVLLTARRQAWIVGGLIAAAAVVGALEIFAYSTAAEKVSGKTASFRPFITARLIDDGPGYDYILENCPDAEIPTCAMRDVLTRSDNPDRLLAWRVIFDRSDDLGTFRLLPQEAQSAVAADQRAFFFRVLADRPFAVMAAFLENTLRQTVEVGIGMTVPDDDQVETLEHLLNAPNLETGDLAEDRSWIDEVTVIHESIYLASLAAIAVLLVWPGLATREMRIFAVFMLLGILINAFVCGAVSTPAMRYGARVAWLLPYVATLMTIVALRRRALERGTDPALRRESAA
jgi:hypothetical protein